MIGLRIVDIDNLNDDDTAINGLLAIDDSAEAPAGIGSLASTPKAAEILIVPPTVTVNVSATASGTVLLIVISTSSVASQFPPSVTLYVKYTNNGSEPVTY